MNTQGYRSGHNEAVLKTVWGNPRGFESHSLRNKTAPFMGAVLFHREFNGIRKGSAASGTGGKMQRIFPVDFVLGCVLSCRDEREASPIKGAVSFRREFNGIRKGSAASGTGGKMQRYFHYFANEVGWISSSAEASSTERSERLFLFAKDELARLFCFSAV